MFCRKAPRALPPRVQPEPVPEPAYYEPEPVRQPSPPPREPSPVREPSPPPREPSPPPCEPSPPLRQPSPEPVAAPVSQLMQGLPPRRQDSDEEEEEQDWDGEFLPQPPGNWVIYPLNGKPIELLCWYLYQGDWISRLLTCAFR